MSVLVGHVAVDSGQVVIVDPCYVLDGEYGDRSSLYGVVCDVTLGPVQAGEWLAKGIGGTAVASASGYGDGLYPVFADYSDDGRVIRLTIQFD